MSRRLVVGGVAAVLGFVVLLATIQAVENRHEYGVFEPISERSLAEWYGAWTAVFVVHPDNAEDPALAEWYDAGSPYPAFQDAVARSPDYSERREVLRDRIHEMFDAAGTTSAAERVDAFVGALLGARTDDIEPFVDGVLAAAPGDGRAGLAYNEYGQQDRVDALLADLNDGQPPGVVTTGPLFDGTQRSSADYRDVKVALAAVALALMAIGVVVPGRHRPACMGVLAAVVAIAAVLATGYIDNARYLVGPLTLMTIGGVLAARALAVRIGSQLMRTTEDSGRYPPPHRGSTSCRPETASSDR